MHTLTKREYSIGKMNLTTGGGLRNSSHARFSTANNAHNNRYMGNSMQNMRKDIRAKSSTRDHAHMRKIMGGQNSDLGAGMSATALSQIPPKTNVPVLDSYY